MFTFLSILSFPNHQIQLRSQLQWVLEWIQELPHFSLVLRIVVASLVIHRLVKMTTKKHKKHKKLKKKNTKRQKHTNTSTLLFGLDVSCGLTGDSQVRRSNNHWNLIKWLKNHSKQLLSHKIYTYINSIRFPWSTLPKLPTPQFIVGGNATKAGEFPWAALVGPSYF